MIRKFRESDLSAVAVILESADTDSTVRRLRRRRTGYKIFL